VNLYLEFAELQAHDRKPMTMRNWIEKLDEFLKISGASCWITPGRFPTSRRCEKRNWNFQKFRAIEDAKPSAVEKGFRGSGEKIEALPPGKQPKKT